MVSHFARSPVLAEMEQLEADAERYRWLCKTAPDCLCHIAYRYQAACKYEEPDECIDAAMAAEDRKEPNAAGGR